MPRRILIVDDDPLIRSLIMMSLPGAIYKFEEAPDGKQALALLQRVRPDLVLLDVNMLEMDGFEVLKAIKCDPLFTRIPVIMLTAMRSENEVRKALSLGAAGYIAKPFDQRTLHSRVELALRGNPARTSPAQGSPSGSKGVRP